MPKRRPPTPSPALPKVLVVDDEENLRHMFCEMLTREGYDVVTAALVDEALDLVTSTDCDIILSDIRMPERDGWELLDDVSQRSDSDFRNPSGRRHAPRYRRARNHRGGGGDRRPPCRGALQRPGGREARAGDERRSPLGRGVQPTIEPAEAIYPWSLAGALVA